jgi:endonuclease/exonuclease/phosphatase family metal-dependent hydrolase
MLYQKVNKKYYRTLTRMFLCCFYVLTACGHSRLESKFYQDAQSSPCATGQHRPFRDGIQWKILLHERERAELASWCHGIGSPLILSPPDVGKTNEALDTLTLISWNIHVGGADVSQFVTDLRQGVVPAIEQREHFILLLQEAFRTDASVPATVEKGMRNARAIKAKPANGERIDIRGLARRHKLYAYYVPSMRNGEQQQSEKPEDRGNAILSTLPLTSLLAIELPYERQRRVAIGATVSGTTSYRKKWELQVINVHLDNRSHWHRLFDSFGESRRRQAAAIMEAILGTTPTVLGGDLNTWYRGGKELSIRFLQQFFELPVEALSFKTLHSGFGLLKRTTDYLFFRLPASWTYHYTTLDKRYGSDHYPVIGRIRIGNGSSKTHEKPSSF